MNKEIVERFVESEVGNARVKDFFGHPHTQDFANNNPTAWLVVTAFWRGEAHGCGPQDVYGNRQVELFPEIEELGSQGPRSCHRNTENSQLTARAPSPRAALRNSRFWRS
jgi:hypothetical protein